MDRLTDYPLLVFVVAFVCLWLAYLAGVWLRRRRGPQPVEDSNQDLEVVQAATATLLALLIGFSFSMAADRYNQRKVLEEGEANAIGTEFVRAELLPVSDAANTRRLLTAYLQQRILFYTPMSEARRAQVNQSTNQLQSELWVAVRGPALAQPTPVAALAVAGMNDVLNSQGYAQAAAWNRIPREAWYLMSVIAIGSNFLIGYGSKTSRLVGRLSYVLPFVLAIAFLLIADIDSPRHGLIRVHPQNLESLASSIPQ
jgi:hypothetical protein